MRGVSPRAFRIAALSAFAALLAAGAGAQTPAAPSRPRPAILQPLDLPLLVRRSESRPTMLSQRPIPPLAGVQLERFNRARMLRESGKYEEARRLLVELLREAPHHPLLLEELAGIHEDRGEWRAIEGLARAERAAQKDSLLLAPSLALALERLVRPREAAQVVAEAWAATAIAPQLWSWAGATIARLAAVDSRGVREPIRRAAERRPDHSDLVRCAARLEWRGGDPAAALRLLALADRGAPATPSRWTFAEEMLAAASPNDSSGAAEALLDLAGDARRDPAVRLAAARRAWQVFARRGEEATGAPRIARALADLPAPRWGGDLLLQVARALRQSGQTAEARRLMGAPGADQGAPEVAIERALTELRDGPPEKALPALREGAARLPEAAFRYAEALFFAGQPDSALAWYERISKDPTGTYTGAALERIYLIEDADPRTALPLFGRMAWEQWRGETKRALVMAESLYHQLPHRALWAQAALQLAALREAAADPKTALEPLLAVADGLADDRLAPVARQRAGDVYRVWYKDDMKALEQYEECLARYPRAWNAPEVRRQVEALRRERRF